METPEPAWTEESSRQFIELGRVFTPSRDEIRDTIVSLIPAIENEPFLAVELGVGEGWLSEAILRRFPAAHVLGLDGSDSMLRATGARLRPHAGRYELRSFRLEDRDWRDQCGDDVCCFVSSLVLHHLDMEQKRELYHDLYSRLADGGALLIADVVEPRSEWERRYMARAWDVEVRRQSEVFTGTLDAYLQFVESDWNLYEHPDPLDMPSSVADHLAWLAESGFTGTSIFWLRAGHAVFGGYKRSQRT